MSDGDICSDDKKYGGFGAAMAKLLRRRDHAVPACAVAAVSVALSSGTKKSLSVTATERTWLTKPPCKRQKESNVYVPAPQAEAPAAVPALVPLVTANNAVAQAPVGRKKLPPVLPAVLTVVPVPFLFGEPIHPSGIVIDIVGTEMSCQGRSCDKHEICSEVLEADIVVRLRKIQLMVERKEETAIAAIWVTDGIDCCRVGFVPRHMV